MHQKVAESALDMGILFIGAKGTGMDDDDEWDDALLSEIADIESRHLRQAAAGSATPAAAHAAPSPSYSGASGDWACRLCTLKNAAAQAACLVCGTPRGQTYAPSTSPSAPPPPTVAFGGASAVGAASRTAKKTVQSIISFGGPPRQQNAANRPAPAPRSATATPTWPQAAAFPVRVPPAGSVLDPRRQATPQQSSQWSIASQPQPQPQPVTTGEDSEAKQRYVDVVNRSKYPEIDYEAAHEFVYPTNYPVRDYQLAITEKALYHNTLVSLPTGLGKTLIASVVMYNFYRWFPRGKIVFMAPTKPLVAQQIKACHEIMGIPQADTAELQGSVSPAVRKVLWKSKRVFFCTPQSMQNDLRHGVCRAEEFVCLVVDEAHRATGNYAYCCVLQEVEQKTPFFRVLALSATPGSKFDIIQDVVKNLRISHIESRSADDADVKKYTHARQEEVIVCRLSNQITEVKALLMKVFQRIVNRLFQGNVIQYRDPDKLTRWYVLQAREKFRQSPSYESNRSAESDLAMLISLLHAKNLLTVHGLSSFKDYVMNWVKERQEGARLSWSKREILQSTEFHALELSLTGGNNGAVGSDAGREQPSHPKLVKLREVLHEHFQRHSAGGSSTRAIVFTQYRSSVAEIVELLKPLAPLLKVQQFVGQGTSGKMKENKGQSQKLQQEIVQKFRQGLFNVLVATCIAEEGLDIGEVDLIVSFDALTSPVRMIQRMGRTGRKRVGKVVILVTEGDEEKKLARSASAAKTVSRALTTFKNKFSYSKCPRMIPNGIRPALTRLEMNIPEFQASKVAGKQIADGYGRRRYEQLGITLDESWKLNDIERSIANTKFFPVGFNSSERNLLYPVVAPRRHLVRRRSVAEGKASSLVGYSRKSLVLLSMVRKINGVDEDPWEYDMLSRVQTREHERAADADADSEAPVSQSYEWQDPSEISVGSIGSPRRNDSANNSFSDVLNESVLDMGMHFSPQYIDPVPDNAAPGAVELAVGNGTGMTGKRTQRSADLSSKPSLTNELSSPARKKAAVSSSKGKKTAKAPTAASSPPQPRKGALISSDDLQRGERLLEQLQELRSLARSLSQSSLTPVDDESMASDEEAGHANSKAPDQGVSLPDFPRLSISRQLTFHQVDDDEQLDSRMENCVPEPPPSLCASLSSPTPVREQHDSTESEPFGTAQAVGVAEAAIAPVAESTAPPPRRSLALRMVDEAAVSESTATKRDIRVRYKGEAKPSEPRSRDVRAADQQRECIDLTTTKEPSLPVADRGEVKVKTPAAQRERVPVDVVDLTAHSPDVTVNNKSRPKEITAGSSRDRTARVTTDALARATQREDDACSICREAESFDDDPIVFCDSCEVAVHQFCYGIARLPEGSWFCDACSSSGQTAGSTSRPAQLNCHLCPLRGGAMKKTVCGRWVHVQCFLWIPELQLHKNDTEVLLGSLDALDPAREELDCSLCHSQRRKGIIQCAYKCCLVAFHVSCASFAHHKLVQVDPPEDHQQQGTMFLAYCPLHQNASHAIRTASTCGPKSSAPAPRHSEVSPRTTNTDSMHASPSALLLSMRDDDDSAQKFRKFRRLKRKYEATQSPGEVNATRASPEGNSPWGKRVKRSQKRMERKKLRAMASLFIESEVDVRGEREDEYGDEDDYSEADAEDDSFINDSSQLLYSQTPSPSARQNGKKRRKRRDGSLPGDMRAIYARALLESPGTPEFLRRARQRGSIPADGIISACLDKMESVAPTPTPTAASPMRGDLLRDVPAVDSSSAAAVGVGDISRASEPADHVGLDDTRRIGAGIAEGMGGATRSIRTGSNDDVDVEQAPCFDLLSGFKLPVESVSTSDSVGVGPPLPTAPGPSGVAQSSTSVGTNHPPATDPEEDAAKIRERIEANRLKALEKLQQRRQVKLMALSPASTAKSYAPRQATPPHLGAGPSRHMVDTATSTGSAVHDDPMTEAPSFQLLSTAASFTTSSVGRGTAAVSGGASPPATVSIGMPGNRKEFGVFVSASFASSPSFSALVHAKSPSSSVDIDDSLEADALLSARTAVLWLSTRELDAWVMETPGRDPQKHPRIRTLLAIFKRLVVAVESGHDDEPRATEAVGRLQQLSNAKVVVRPDRVALCEALHRIAM